MNNMITTGPNFEGFRITGYYGIITAEALFQPHLRHQEEKWEEGRQSVYAELFNRLPTQANAIIGLQVSHIQFCGNYYFFATGTAVSIAENL